MPDWILIAVIIAVAGGIVLVLSRKGRGRSGRGGGQDAWIGGDVSNASYDGSASAWSATDYGAAPADDFSGGGGDSGGGGASGGWDGGGGDSGDSGGGGDGGGDGGGGSD